MKRRFTILTAALALLVSLAIPMGMWGQETVTATSTTMTARTTYQDLETGKLIEYKNSASNDYSQPLRIYANNTFTIHAKDGVEKITQIAIVANSTSYANTTGSATWTATGEGSCSATASVSGSNVTVTITGTATTVTCKPSAQIRWNQLSVTYVTVGTPPAITYTMTYNANGGTGTMIDDNSPYDANAMVTVLDNEFTRDHFDFVKWNTKADGTGTDYDEGDTFTISDNTTLYAQWVSDGTGGEGSICFSSQSSCTAINGTSVTGEDNLGNTWAITTTGTSSFTANSGYYQVGSGNSPATSITFTTSFDEEVNVTDFSAIFGGFSATRASVVLKVDNTQVGSGTLNGSADVTVSSSSPQIGTTLTVIVTPTAGGVRCYNISYAYETITPSQAVNTTTTINVPANFNTDIYHGTTAGTLTATVSAEGTPISGATVTWSSSNTGVATIDANGAVTLVAVGTTTISASYAGVEDEYRPSTGTYELTVTDSNAPGTENNPYTVAEAIANTPSSGNVYIQGIVSSFYNTSIVGDGSNYRYYISDDGTTTTQLLVYKGKGLNQTTFTNADDLLVGDEVVIYGTLITYQSAPEVASGNYLYSWNRPAAAVEAPTFSLAAGTYTSAQNVTLSCATAGATIYYTLDGTEPTSACMQYTAALTISSTTTVKAIAYVGTDASTVATATYHFCSAEDPYTVTEALAFNEYPANGIYVHGIVSTAPTQSPTNNGELTYYISVDGNATNQLEVYKGKGLNEAEFEAQDDIQVGDIVTIYGNVVIYNGTKEFASGNYLVSFERPAQQYTLTVTCSENVEIFTFVGESTDPGVEGSTTLQVTNGTEVGISVSASEGYVLTLIVDGENVTSDLDDSGYYTFLMPSHAVTVTATAVEDVPPTPGDKYVKVTSATDLTSGQYLIVYEEGSVAFDGSLTTLDAASNTISVVTNNNEIGVDNITTAAEFTIDVTAGTIKSASGYYIGRTANSNGMNTNQETAYTNTISIDGDGNAVILASGGAYLRYNSNIDQKRFRYFKSDSYTGQKAIQLYKKVVAEETYTLEIEGYGDTQNPGGWYLIASPIGNVAPTNVAIEGIDNANMVSGTFDLFYFDHTKDNEWVNYKRNESGEGNASTDPGFNLISGKGYLYANSEDVTLVFTGTAPTDEEVEVTLDYEASAEMPGWNLVGNPFAVTANIMTQEGHTLYFYTLNAAGDEFVAATNTTIDPMEGVFVEAKVADEKITFTRGESAKGSLIALNLSNGRNIIDRAIVRFNECRPLHKLQLNKNHSKVYISMEGEDYAVVRGEEMGEMPVSFKAENNGSYTLSVNAEEMSFAYLHLIDNMTGNDVDLLQTPSYSFEAKTTDYESRFKLVFATGDNSNDDNFAFYSNGSFVINNEGNAELQVIDIMGRIVKSESINGCANVSVNGAAGVYMLRLVNGDNVKVQKVVVK